MMNYFTVYAKIVVVKYVLIVQDHGIVLIVPFTVALVKFITVVYPIIYLNRTNYGFVKIVYTMVTVIIIVVVVVLKVIRSILINRPYR